MARGVDDFFAKHGGVQAPSLAEIAASLQEAVDHKWIQLGDVAFGESRGPSTSISHQVHYVTIPLGTFLATQLPTPYPMERTDPEGDLMEFMRQRNARKG